MTNNNNKDADRLDAIGAIGIARTFCFGGRFSRPLYDDARGVAPPPTALEAGGLTREAYMKAHAGGGATVDHFYEKLLTLKGRMKTAAGRRLAGARHAYMEGFLAQLGAELAGEA